MNLKSILFIVFIFIGVKGFSQNTTQTDHFKKVVPGLSEVRVREIVGVPARVEPFVTINPTSKDTSTFWVYQNLYTIIFKNHVVDRVESDRVAFLQQVQQWNKPGNKEGVYIKYGQ